jgi:hypothetical protein
VGAPRFDDPDGEVGVETHVLRTADGQIIQVPLTYRDRALHGAENSLITKMHHSVLGECGVNDASADPVYARTLATTIFCGGEQAELTYLEESGPQKRETMARVLGNGSPTAMYPEVKYVTFVHAGNATIVDTGDCTLRVRRVVDLGPIDDSIDGATLWSVVRPQPVDHSVDGDESIPVMTTASSVRGSISLGAHDEPRQVS